MKLFKDGKRPDKSGRYWFRPKGYAHTRVVEIYGYESKPTFFFTNENFGIPLTDERYDGGTWIGPLPTMEQLEKELTELEL